VKIFVISLKNSPRRAAMQAQMEKLGLEFTFFDAFVGKKEIYQSGQYAKLFRKLLYGFDLTLGEIGCYQSHSAVWGYAITYNEPILVLEDDVILDKQLPDFLAKLETLLAERECDFGLLRLSGTFERKLYKVKDHKFSPYQLYSYYKYPSGMLGYVITPNAAKILLFYSRKIRTAIDDFLDRTEFLYGVKTQCVYPYLVLHNEEISSDIGDRSHFKSRKTWYNRIFKEIFNGYLLFKKVLFRLI
jgi:glycosyl transferase family 25